MCASFPPGNDIAAQAVSADLSTEVFTKAEAQRRRFDPDSQPGKLACQAEATLSGRRLVFNRTITLKDPWAKIEAKTEKTIKRPKRRRLVIIDSSFIRGDNSQGVQLGKLVAQEMDLVFTEGLLYELMTTTQTTQLSASFHKLNPHVESVRGWLPVNWALQQEVEGQTPCTSLEHPKFTQNLRRAIVDPDFAAIFRNGLQTAIPKVAEWREQKVTSSLFAACNSLEEEFTALSRRLFGKSHDSIGSEVARFVNDDANIRAILVGGEDGGPWDSNKMNEAWMGWHVARAFLAFLCEFLRTNQKNSFEELIGDAQHRWINKMIDLDYVVALSRADAIATGETNGEMFHYCRWLYGDTKSFISLLR